MPTGWLTNVPVPYKMEDARWWDEGWVQDFPPCVTECLRESPNVGDIDDGGKGTKVWRLLGVVRSRRKF